MAPEMAGVKGAQTRYNGFKSDVWSAGMVMFIFLAVSTTFHSLFISNPGHVYSAPFKKGE